MAKSKAKPKPAEAPAPEAEAQAQAPAAEAQGFTLPPRPRGDWREMKANPMWPEQVRALIRGFVAPQGEKLPPCPVCGSKKRGRWTMLCPFLAFKMAQFTIEPAGGTFAPLTLVCHDHPIRPIEPIMDAL